LNTSFSLGAAAASILLITMAEALKPPKKLICSDELIWPILANELFGWQPYQISAYFNKLVDTL
jgi:hypothetical protein